MKKRIGQVCVYPFFSYKEYTFENEDFMDFTTDRDGGAGDLRFVVRLFVLRQFDGGTDGGSEATGFLFRRKLLA